MAFNAKDYDRWLLVGEGGEARVFRARQIALDRLVAIRQIKPLAAERSEREAKLLAGLRHQGLAGVIDYGYSRQGFHIVQDFVRGVPLVEYAPQAPLSVLAVARSLASTLAFLHSREVVHGDLNPGNLILPSARQSVLVDFGMVRLLGQNSSAALGAPLYFSPEHVTGESLDPHSDIFSFGLLLYYMLTGEHLLQAKDLGGVQQEILAMQSNAGKENIALRYSIFDERLWSLFEGCLSFLPQDRFEDMDELDENLEIAERAFSTSDDAHLQRARAQESQLLHDRECRRREIRLLSEGIVLAKKQKRWSDALAFAEELSILEPAEASWTQQIRILQGRRRNLRKGAWLMAFGFLLLALALSVLLWPNNTTVQSEALGKHILLQSRSQSKPLLENLDANKNIVRERLVALPADERPVRVLRHGVPLAIDDGYLTLPVGKHDLQFEHVGPKGEIYLRMHQVQVPEQGETQWSMVPAAVESAK